VTALDQRATAKTNRRLQQLLKAMVGCEPDTFIGEFQGRLPFPTERMKNARRGQCEAKIKGMRQLIPQSSCLLSPGGSLVGVA
jgi:hypothetical protein